MPELLANFQKRKKLTQIWPVWFATPASQTKIWKCQKRGQCQNYDVWFQAMPICVQGKCMYEEE